MKESDQLARLVAENIEFDKIGSDKVVGLDALIDSHHTDGEAVTSLEIKEILTHGKEAAAHGTVVFGSKKQLHFSEFYTFESHKKEAGINSITNYILQFN